MRRHPFAGFVLTFVLAPGCVADDGRDELWDSADRGTPGIDVADYLMLDCAGPSSANQVGSQVKYTIPMGMDGDEGRFVIMKSSDGAGFEEWTFDDEWFYIRLDTTWAYENPANPGQWCDTQCGDNGPGNCKQRWAGDSGDWVYTVYHEPGNYDRPARWLPRQLDIGFGQSTDFTTTMGIQAERYADCAPCATNFSSPSVDRSVRASLHPSWHGFSDVLELRVLAGPGAGERYYYGRGRGWIGFNDWVADAEPVVGTATPSLACGGFVQGPVCEVDDPDGEAESPPPPPVPPPGGDGLPDVRVTGLSWTPASPRPGDAVRFHAEVVNDGDVATPQVVGVGFAVDGVTEHGFWSVVEPIAAGGSRTLTMDVAWVPAEAGPYSVTAHVDDIDRFEESSEGNNVLDAVVVVSDGGEPPPEPPPSEDPPQEPPPQDECPCLYGTAPSGEPISNFCHYPADTPGCAMLEPGGYCDPNGDGSFADADWVAGWNDYAGQC